MMEMLFLVLLLIAGTGTHVLKKIVERRQTDDTFSAKDWLTKYPYKTALTFMAGVGGFLALMAVGELTFVSAFMTGYVANSLGGAAE
jgi:hypothetical protein